ncbi:MAG: hypothetical protein R3279_02850, partial [Putridiphycobacter sp.]|nr:hypothetical protein [Putridiphycobacter sp.]
MRLLLLLFLFTSSFLVYGQEKDVEIVVNLKDDDTGKKLSGATVSVYAEGKLITSSTSSSSGKVPTIYVQTGKYYQIYIRKNGYVTKMAELDARIDLLEDAPDPLFLNFETALFQGVDGVDFSFLESTPMTKFDFDSEYYYRYDKAYTEQMLKKIDELKKQIAEKREEEDKKEKEAKKTEADFLAYVEAGDKAVKDVRYETAIEQYNLALGLRKDDVDVKNKLKEAQRLLDEQKKNEAQEKLYLAKMSEALQAYKGDKLEEAINLYTEASALKREAQEPKDKIDEIRQKIAEQKALEQKIKTLVTSGDMAMAAEGFDEAIEKYTEALGLKDDADIKAKLERAKQQKKAFDEAAEAEKLKIEQYNALMKSAEDLFVKKQLAEAKLKFSEALVLMPEEAIPQRRIEEIDKQLAAQKAAEEKMQAYKEKMQEAETAEGKKEWQAAIEFYKAALAIQPLEQEPQLKIKELTTVLEKEKALKEEYAKFIKEGDQFASTEAYEEAVSKYEKARQIDETDEVTKKIKDALDAMQILAEARNKALKLEAEYKALIEKADKERDSDQITEAIASYSEAQKLKEEETYPTEEIEKLKVLMEQRQAEAEAKAKAEAAYQAIIDAANSAFENKEWEVAKSKYSEAKNLRENDPLPIAKLQEIEKLLADLAAAEAKNKAYEAAMTAGREAFEAKSYDEALGQYLKAKGIKENETAPQQKIDEINKILADMKDEAAKEEAYIAAMDKGEELVKGKSYKDAIEAYTSALSFKPGDEKATEEIEKINNMLDEQAKQLAKEAEFKALTEAGDALFADKKYEEAKLKFNSAIAIKSDENVLNKIKLCDEQISLLGAIAAKQDAFNNLLKEADDQFKAENWTEAISKYEAAKAIEANDYIIAQIKAANDKLQDLEDNKALNNKIEGLIASAKEYEAAKNYQKALNTYKEAYLLREMPEIESAIKNVEKEIATIKAEEITNKDYLNKIAEADAALKSKNFATAIDLYRAASSIKETEKYPKDQIAVCESELAKLDEKKNLAEYNEVIAGADQLFSTEKYDQAITQYEKAKLIIPSKTYPDEKIKEIKAIRDKIANAEAERIKQENEYKSLVTLGDNKFDTQNFEDAIATYRSAQKIKAFDPYVEGRIKIAEEKLAEVNAAKATAQKYQSYIDKADALMAKEEWKLAIAEYNTALIYDKSNPYPKSQIALAEKAMETDSQELSETAYQDLLKEAQAKMDAKAYEASLTLYKSAFRQRPTDSRPADKIRELNALIANELATASAESKYKTLIDKADNLFEKKEWKKARVYYVEAYNLTNDSYPDDQIKKIDAINNKFSSDQYSKMISKADEYFEDENYEKAKGLYTRAIKTFTSQNSSYPKSQIKKINAILNPPALVASGNTKPVGEKVNMTEAEIQKLFAEAEEASKNKQVTNVFNSGQSA